MGGERVRARVLAALLLVYTLNYADRQVLGILAAPIKADLHLSDAAFGAVGGLAFALLYATMGVPLALLADRTGRARVIAGALAAWSLFTALCGAATGFWSLFAARLGVGVGEAGGTAPAYALLSATFPPGRRARAIAIYSLGSPIGVAASTLGGAYLAARVEWRAAFVVLGGLGLLAVPVFRLLVRDPPPAATTPRASSGAVLPTLARNPAFWLLGLAGGCSSLVGYGLALWTPSILQRSFGLDLIGTGQAVASLSLIGGTAGVWAGGWLADRLGRTDVRWHAWLPAIAWTLSVPTFALGFAAPSLAIAWPVLLVPSALSLLWLPSIVAAVQHLAPPHQRASAGGAFLLLVNLMGLGVGPWLMGRLSDGYRAAYGVDALRHAGTLCLVFYLVAAALACAASGPLRRRWVAG